MDDNEISGMSEDFSLVKQKFQNVVIKYSIKLELLDAWTLIGVFSCYV